MSIGIRQRGVSRDLGRTGVSNRSGNGAKTVCDLAQRCDLTDVEKQNRTELIAAMQFLTMLVSLVIAHDASKLASINN